MQKDSALVPLHQRFVSLMWHQLHPCLARLDQQLDLRLVRTLWALLLTLVCWPRSLALTDLARSLADEDVSTQAWVKRLSNLLHSSKWATYHIHQFMLARGLHFARTQQVQLAHPTGFKRLLCLWDDSVWEKPETLTQGHLDSVRSTRAGRLNRIRPGYFHPPKGSTHVPGLHWTLICIASSTRARLLCSRFWSARLLSPKPKERDNALEDKPKDKSKAKPRISAKSRIHTKLLLELKSVFGRDVIHVFDRGFSGWPWLSTLMQAQVSFVVRWSSHHFLLGPGDERPRRLDFIMGKKELGRRTLWDAVRRCPVECVVRVKQVYHPKDPTTPLWLVSCKRQVKGHKAWYLLTNEPVNTEDEAWQVVSVYARRWEVERQIRTQKTEFDIESVQLRDRAARSKLLALVGLGLNLLMELLEHEEVGPELIKKYNPRRGEAARKVKKALHQLKGALEIMWRQCFWPIRHLMRFCARCLRDRTPLLSVLPLQTWATPYS